MAFAGIADFLTEHYVTTNNAKAHELRFWTDDGTGQPGTEATTLRTSLDSINTPVSTNAGTKFAFDGYAEMSLGSDVTTPSYDPANDNTGDPVDIEWVQLYDTSYGDTMAFAQLGSPTTVADGQQVTVNSSTNFQFGRPGSDDIAPAPGNLTYTEPNPAIADAIAVEVPNSNTIAGNDELRVYLDITSGTTTDDPQVFDLTASTVGITTSVTAGEGRVTLDFGNNAQWQFEDSFTVEGVTLALYNNSISEEEFFAYDDKTDSENFGTQYTLNSFDIVL